MTTMTGLQGEWTAAPLRLTARWVPASDPDGGSHLEMVWSVPDVHVGDLTAAPTHPASAT